MATRIRAVQVLGQLGDSATPYLKAVLAYLKDEKIDDSARGKAAEALINIGNTTHVTDILNFLKDNKVDFAVRRKVASEFSYLPRDVIAPSITVFLDFLEDTKVDSSLQYEVASVFGNLGDKAKFYSKDIFSFLKDGKISPGIRRNVWSALFDADPSLWGGISPPSPDDKNDDIVGTQTVYKVDGKVHVIRQSIVSRIVTGPSSSRFFRDPKMAFEVLKDDKIDAPSLRGVAYALTNLGDDATPHIKELVKLLKDKKMDTNVRRSAAFALGNLEEAAKPYAKDILEFFKNDITVDIDDGWCL